MVNLLLVLAQIVLAFFIASTLYLLCVYYIKTFISKPEEDFIEQNPTLHHFAIVFNNYISEENLLRQIQFLNTQPYKNFSAYFFIDDPYVTINNMSHVRIIRPTQKRFGRFGLLNAAKNYFENAPDAVLVIDPSSTLTQNYLEEMNLYLCKGFRVIQGQVQSGNLTDKENAYQNLARRFYNLIDRKAHQANGLSSALWNQGFVIEGSLFEKLNFESYTESDKALQAELIIRSEKIVFANEAKLMEPEYSNEELLKQKQNWYQQYFFNYRLGINLLLEGIKNPNIEKIFFGINFMRPPLMVLMISSICLATLDLIWMPKAAFFLWLAIIGLVTSILLLSKPAKTRDYLNSLGISIKAITSGNRSKKISIEQDIRKQSVQQTSNFFI